MVSVTLNNGVKLPILGLGVWKMPEGEITQSAVKSALDIGYRHIDTAQLYRNEYDVGVAVARSGVLREQIFITSKLAVDNFGYEKTLKEFEISKEKLQSEYIDLFLLHWPVHKLRLESWKALEEIYRSGKCKAIGVSNFTIEHLEELMSQSEIVPAVNQVEFSPYLYQQELHEYCKSKGIQLEAYSPLTKGRKFDDPRLVEIASKYKKTPAQILIRWCIQHEVVVIPKSVHPERQKENFEVFDFEISSEDMLRLDSFNENYRTSWNPTSNNMVKLFSAGALTKISKKLTPLRNRFVR